jgi:hypothetical protein
MGEVTKRFSNYGKTYSKDKRKDIKLLYKSFLSVSSSWIIDVVDNHIIKKKKEEIKFPVLSLRTKKKGKAIWVISGTHGEEPAGPIAIAKNMKFLKELGKIVPVVILPLVNPMGYHQNWRYLFHWKDWKIGKSIGDCEAFLLNRNNKPIHKRTHIFAERFVKYIFSLTKKYPPFIVLDFHEDEIKTSGGDPLYNEDEDHANVTYIYSQGRFGANDLIANKTVEIMRKFKHPLVTEGFVKTKSKDKIYNGIVSGIRDGSVDEFLGSKKIFFNGRVTKGPYAETVVVIETLTNIPLIERIKIHSKIITSLKEFIQLSKEQT